MRGNDIFLVVFILLVFAALYAYTILVVALADIQDNWPIYRCNPMVMPFADQFGISPTMVLIIMLVARITHLLRYKRA